MANKAISELPQALNVNNQDLFVLEQSGIAKKLPAETFITEQGIINALAEALDGHGGISSVTLSSVSGRVRTYRITFTDQSATTFQVYDGTSIERISRTSSSGLDDVYTVFLSDGTTTFFTVHNGADGTVSEAMLNDALKNKAPAITETTESSAIANFTDGADDMPMQSLVADIEPVQDLNGYDAPWPAGSKNQLIFKTISGNIESNGKIVSTTDFHLLVAKVTAAQTYISSADGVATSSGALVLAFFSSEPEIGSVSYDGQRITTGQNPFVAPIDGYVAIRVASSSDVRRQIEAGSTATAYYPYSNICPITGWTGCNVTRTGANVWDEEWEVGMLNTSTGVPASSTANIRSKNYIPVKPNTEYYLVGPPAVTFVVWGYDAEYNPIKRLRYNSGGLSFTTSDDSIRYVRFSTLPDSGSYGNTYNHDIGINYPLSDHDYHAYQSTTLTVDWQTEAGTVYGGTIDVATGVLTVDRRYTTIGNESVYRIASSQYSSFEIAPSAANKAKSQNSEILCVSSAFVGVSFNAASANGDNYIFASGGNIRIKNTANASLSASEWKQLMTDVQIAYKLATPQTYQLSGQQLMTLLGTNNVWADTGDTSVTYPADTKMFIEKLTMPTEDDLVANQAITSGKYFMIGNSLYLALANIASGAQITIGTNAQRVSLADALNTINS